MNERAIATKTSDSTRESRSQKKQHNLSHSAQSPAEQILFLHQTIGNQAVQRLFKSGVIQAKLRIGQPNDIYEQEAVRVADAVMRIPEPKVQRQPEEEKDTVLNDSKGTIQAKPLAKQITPLVQRQFEEEEEELIQPKENSSSTAEVTPAIESNINLLRGGGQPLPESVRTYFEPKFGYDFSHVRVHTDSNAVQMSKELNAEAFTHGRDIYFGAGRYNPGTSSGKRLIAHELTHVVQQRQSLSYSNIVQIQLSPDLRFGNRTRTLRNRWHEDYDIFRQRVRTLLVSQLDVPSTWVYQLLHVSNLRFTYDVLDRADPLRHNGTVVVIRVDYGARGSVGASNLVFTVPETPPSEREPLPRAAPAIETTRSRAQGRQTAATPAKSEIPRPGETREERLRRQARTMTQVLSQVVADADREGYTGISLTIRHTGDELVPAFVKHEPRQARPTGTIPVSAITIAREQLQNQMEFVLMSGTGLYQIEFAQNEQGRMAFRSYRRIEPTRPRAEREELEALGIPSRLEIYAQIFEQAERELREAGIMVAGIALRELAMWIAGGVILRGLGLLGRVGLRGFSSLRAALRSRQAASEIGRAIQTLSREQADDFARIMRKVQNDDTLTDWEMRLLRELLERIDSALGRATVTTIARAFRFASPQVWRYSGREIVVLETSEGLQAFYRRTGGGPGRPAGHAGAQAGEWAPFDGFMAGYFAKSRYFDGIDPDSLLYSFGSQEFREASQWIAQQALPAAREMTEWLTIQLELQRLGARVAMRY